MGVLACSLAALLLAGTGGTSRHLETVLQDDAMLLHRPPVVVRQTARTLSALGVDRVRLTAGWSVIAPDPRARTRPDFDATDPSAYPHGAWDELDTAVNAARDAGLAVMIDIGFWAPRWAVHKASANPSRDRYAPNPDQFADFAAAVVRRYGAVVHLYTPWNEPNHPSFLAPQWRRGRPLSPHVYRAMYEAAYAAIKRVRPDAKVLLGNTSATGSKGGVPPLRFLRTLACVDARLEPLHVPECADFQPLKADGYAHHPYSKTTDPAAADPNPDDAPLSASSRLEGLLAALADRGRITTRLPLYDTEYGYESSPDDPTAPYDRDGQARYLAKASFLAWKDGGTQMFAQFLLRDLGPARDWQSGLYAADGTAKPAVQAFKLPFWVEPQTSAQGPWLLAWGEVRPGWGRQTVRIEQQVAGGAWQPVHTTSATCSDQVDFLTDDFGSLVTALPATGPATYRMAWRRPDGVWEYSVPVPVSGP
jgi:hypothetical protein